jgi:CheY-like chemotaxis protein
VLLVDDTPSNSRMLKMLLEKRGFVCDLAEDGAVAVEMVKDNVAERGMMQDKAEASRHAYKLIFMDHQMPVMDGLEATQTLRTACNVSAIIVGCTGNTDERDQAAFVAAGADYVLPKPVRLADVDKLVEYCRYVVVLCVYYGPPLSCRLTLCALTGRWRSRRSPTRSSS